MENISGIHHTPPLGLEASRTQAGLALPKLAQPGAGVRA